MSVFNALASSLMQACLPDEESSSGFSSGSRTLTISPVEAGPACLFLKIGSKDYPPRVSLESKGP